jgi:hypothetical protein
MTRNPSIERLRELLSYDPVSGVISWRVPGPGRRRGNAGHQVPGGYLHIGIDRKVHYGHRIAWALHYGAWPDALIDHIDGNPANNCIENLRTATRAQNNRNKKIGSLNTSGIKGVRWDAPTKKWRAQIKVDYKTIWLGNFDTKEDAARAYLSAAEKHFGEFARAA